MSAKKYDSLVTALTSFILKYNELDAIKIDAEFDLKWRLTQLYEEVAEEDEQKFIDIAGMQGQLSTTSQKREIAKRAQEVKVGQEKRQSGLSELIQTNKKTIDKSWAKSLYKRAVRRCHPDTLKINDDEYREELTEIYKSITESYENSNLDILMVETYKLFIKPKEVISDQIQILEESKKRYDKKIKNILSSQGFVWSTFSDEMKETFLINLMKQKGVRFVDKQKVKEVLKRKINSRKMGQRPKNKLRERVKNKK
jgi:hypothetical protein